MFVESFNSNAARGPIMHVAVGVEFRADGPADGPFVRMVEHRSVPAAAKLPANVLAVADDPESVIEGQSIGGSGSWPIGIRMFGRNRLRRTEAVAEPLSPSAIGLLLSNTESSMAAPIP